MQSSSLPKLIAIEGPIGVGKSGLALRLAETLDFETVLESSGSNPFLKRFYQNRRQSALQTQLFFLFERARQVQELRQSELFSEFRITDFMIEKDRIYAEANLDADELNLYDNICRHLDIAPITPDLVIYLQAPAEILIDRISQRGEKFDHLDVNYMGQLADAYTSFFHHYEKSTLVIVNAAAIDLVNNNEEYEALVKFILSTKQGRHYYNPVPKLI